MSKKEFETGAHRSSSEGRGNYDSIPPIGLMRLALRCELGDKLHGKNNWKKGIPLSSYLDSALRHINDYRMGNLDEDHVAAAAWNLLAMAETENLIINNSLPDKLDDIGNVLSKKVELEALEEILHERARAQDKQGDTAKDNRVEDPGLEPKQDQPGIGGVSQNSSEMVYESPEINWPENGTNSWTHTCETGEITTDSLADGGGWGNEGYRYDSQDHEPAV